MLGRRKEGIQYSPSKGTWPNLVERINYKVVPYLVGNFGGKVETDDGGLPIVESILHLDVHLKNKGN